MIELTDTNSAKIAAEFVRARTRAGSPVRLLDGRTVLDRSRVKAGTFEVTGRGPVTGARIFVGRGGKVRLTL
jgi:hypothetical protein